jgi:hypothetical protein
MGSLIVHQEQLRRAVSPWELQIFLRNWLKSQALSSQLRWAGHRFVSPKYRMAIRCVLRKLPDESLERIHTM